MIQICPLKKGYLVANVSRNGKLIKASEVLNSKQSCFKNIKAEAVLYNNAGDSDICIQDNTGKKPIVLKLLPDGNKETVSTRTQKVYKPLSK